MKRFNSFWQGVVLSFLLSSATPCFAIPPPGISGALSIIPGLGQTANGNYLEGPAWFLVVVGGFLGSSRMGSSAQTVFLDLWMYNMYDAYRDAGPKKKADYNVFQNYIAVFNPLNILDPVGIIPLVYNGIAVAGPSRPSFAIGPNSRVLTPFSMGFVALGEEGLFRGFIFPGLSDLTDSTIFGAISSSLLFAGAHALYSGQSQYALRTDVFLGRTVLGLIWAWQTHRNQYDLRKSIFSHAWFDVLYEWDRQGMFGGGQIGREQKTVATLGKPTGLVLNYQFKF